MTPTAAVLLLALGVAHARTRSLPPGFKVCAKNDPKLNDCVKDAFESALPKLSEGIPNYGLFPIDPLKITELNIGTGNGPVNIQLKLTDQSFIGFGSMIPQKEMKVNSDPKNFKIETTVFIPQLRLEGLYDISGQILVLPVVGNGHSNLTLTDLNVEVDITGEPFEKDGQAYVKITNFKIDFVPSRLYIMLDNLFNGDKALGENMNNILNENWEIILKELKASICDALGIVFKEISNRIFLKVPISNIFVSEPKNSLT